MEFWLCVRGKKFWKANVYLFINYLLRGYFVLGIRKKDLWGKIWFLWLRFYGLIEKK